MLLYYVRHGDPIYDPDQLTPLGEQQAAALARRLALFGVDEVFASTSNRAIQTAKPTCEALGLTLTTLDFLNENQLKGKLTVKTADGSAPWIWAEPAYAELLCSRELRELGNAWYTHPAFAPFEFEKTILPINEQIDRFIAAYGYEHDTEKGMFKVTKRQPEKRIAIFAHECIGKLFMSHLLDVPFPYYATHFEMHTSGMSVIRFDDGTRKDPTKPPRDYARARLLTLSNDSHLYREDVSLLHRFTHMREQY